MYFRKPTEWAVDRRWENSTLKSELNNPAHVTTTTGCFVNSENIAG